MTTTDQRRQRRASGLCERCGTLKTEQQTPAACCEQCTLKRIATNLLKDMSRASELGEILAAQNNRCIYSGRLLVLGINASVDHKIPLSKGGTHDRENLQWADYNVNRMKSDMEESEFLKLVGEIAARSL